MSNQLLYPSPIEAAISRIESLLGDSKNYISRRALALLLLQKDPILRSQLEQEPYFLEIERIIAETQATMSQSLTFEIAQSRHQLAMAIEQDVAIQPHKHRTFKHEWLHQLTVHPITGIPILALVLYFGIYQFVGVFGGGTLVDGIEGFFESQINPVVNSLVAAIIPWQVIQDLLANDYGIITLGILLRRRNSFAYCYDFLSHVFPLRR